MRRGHGEAGTVRAGVRSPEGEVVVAALAPPRTHPGQHLQHPQRCAGTHGGERQQGSF